MKSRADRKRKAEDRHRGILLQIAQIVEDSLDAGKTWKQALFVADDWLVQQTKDNPQQAHEYRKAGKDYSRILNEAMDAAMKEQSE